MALPSKLLFPSPLLASIAEKLEFFRNVMLYPRFGADAGAAAGMPEACGHQMKTHLDNLKQALPDCLYLDSCSMTNLPDELIVGLYLRLRDQGSSPPWAGPHIEIRQSNIPERTIIRIHCASRTSGGVSPMQLIKIIANPWALLDTTAENQQLLRDFFHQDGYAPQLKLDEQGCAWDIAPDDLDQFELVLGNDQFSLHAGAPHGLVVL